MALITPSQQAVANIDRINTETASFVKAQLNQAYSELWKTGNPQDVLDDLGTNAVAALANYATLYGALDSLGLASGVAPAVETVYVPNNDGTVTYTPAPLPEQHYAPAPIPRPL